MRAQAAATWQTVHRERRLLVEDLAGLPDDQWRLPSLCPGWDLHDVLAHLVDTARTGRLTFVRGLLRARMDFDRANENGIARHKRHHPQDTLEALKEATDRRSSRRSATSCAPRYRSAAGATAPRACASSTAGPERPGATVTPCRLMPSTCCSSCPGALFRREGSPALAHRVWEARHRTCRRQTLRAGDRRTEGHGQS